MISFALAPNHYSVQKKSKIQKIFFFFLRRPSHLLTTTHLQFDMKAFCYTQNIFILTILKF